MEGFPQGTRSDGLATVEEQFCVLSVKQLLALRPAPRSNDGLDFGLRLEDVPPEAAGPFSQPRGGARGAAKPKARGPIGPITECVPVQAEVLRRNKGELRRIEALTGAQIREKAGLRNYTVMVTGTTSIVEQALPLVERALLEEDDVSPEAIARGLPPAEPPPPEPAGLSEPPAEPSLPSKLPPPDPIARPPAGLGSPAAAAAAASAPAPATWQGRPPWPPPAEEAGLGSPAAAAAASAPAPPTWQGRHPWPPTADEPDDAPLPQGDSQWSSTAWWDPLGCSLPPAEEETVAEAPVDGAAAPLPPGSSADGLPGGLQHHPAHPPPGTDWDEPGEVSPAVKAVGDITPTDLPPAVIPEAVFPGRWRQNKASPPVEVQQLEPQAPEHGASPTTAETRTFAAGPPQAPLRPEPAPPLPAAQAGAPPAPPPRLPAAPLAPPPAPPEPESHDAGAGRRGAGAAPPLVRTRPPVPAVPAEDLDLPGQSHGGRATPPDELGLLLPRAEAPGLEPGPSSAVVAAEDDAGSPLPGDTPDGADPGKKKKAKKKKKGKKGDEPADSVQEVPASARLSKAGNTLQNHFSKTAFSGLVDSSESGSDVPGPGASPGAQPKGKSKASGEGPQAKGQGTPKASQKAKKGARPQEAPAPAVAVAKLERLEPPALPKAPAVPDRRQEQPPQSATATIPKPPPPMIPSSAGPGNRSPPPAQPAQGNRSPPPPLPAQGREVASNSGPRSSPWFQVEASSGTPSVSVEQAAAGVVARAKPPPPGVLSADQPTAAAVTKSKAPPPGVLAMEQAAAGAATWGRGPPVEVAAPAASTRGKGPPPGVSGADHGLGGPATKGKGPPVGVPGGDQAVTRGKGPPHSAQAKGPSPGVLAGQAKGPPPAVLAAQGKGPPPGVLAAQAKLAPPPPRPEPKVAHPVPRQQVVAGQASAGRVTTPRAEKVAVTAAPAPYYEEEEDPELACYLWDRRAQRPKNARPAPGPPQRAAAGPPTMAIRAPPPPKGGVGASHASPQQQRALLGQVIDMGFDEPSAKRALNATGWAGVEQAVTLLLGS